MKLTLDYDDIDIYDDDIRVRICEHGIRYVCLDADGTGISIECQSNSLWFASDIEITPLVEAFINEYFEFPSHVILFMHTTLKSLK